MTYLKISSEQFLAAYYDYEFVPSVETKQELEYLKWSVAIVELNKHFPNLAVEFEKGEDGLPTFKTENTLLLAEAKEYFHKTILESTEALKALNPKVDWKEVKNKTKEIQEIKNQLFYNNSGIILKPYLVDKDTGLRTPSLFFPLMNNTNDPVYQADSRDINDNIQRATVKVIAYYTGVGLLVYTRGEGIGKSPITSSPKWIRIKAILEACRRLGKNVDKSIVNFHSSEEQLGELANLLIEEIKVLYAKK